MRDLTAEDYKTIAILDDIQSVLEKEISFAELRAENLHHEEEDIIIRGFIFSQGEREEAIVIGSDYSILYHHHLTHKSIEPMLIKEVCRTLFFHLLETGEDEDEGESGERIYIE